MAKKQTFGDKVNKGSESDAKKKYIKVIRSIRSKDNNALRFSEQMLAIDGNKNLDVAVKEIFNK